MVVERGEELERRTSTELDDLLYAVFRHVTWSMASDFELRNRDQGKDPRRLLFRQQISLLFALDESWGERRRQEIERTLQNHPFADNI